MENPNEPGVGGTFAASLTDGTAVFKQNKRHSSIKEYNDSTPRQMVEVKKVTLEINKSSTHLYIINNIEYQTVII